MLKRLAVAAVIALGLAVGLGAFTFAYARGYSYLTNDPEACGNCHIMSEHLAAWNKSTHHAVATCNDCHTPHNIVGKYTVKAKNGFWHSFYFTTGRYPDPLRITEGNRLLPPADHGSHRSSRAPGGLRPMPSIRRALRPVRPVPNEND
jgi:cytochrome c nitrite reductase small subunit